MNQAKIIPLAITITAPDITRTLPVALLTGDFIQRLDKAAALGYDGIELIVNRPDLLNSEEILLETRRRGLAIYAIASGGQASLEGLTLLSSDPDIARLALKRLRELIRFSSQVNSPVVTIGSFRGRAPEDDPSAGRRRFMEILLEVAEEAASGRVKLAIEPLNRYETNLIHTVVEGLDFVTEAGHSQLGLLVDSFHANIEEGSIAGSIQTAMTAGKLFHVHLGDSNRLAPGQGHIDFQSIFLTLHDTGYSGSCSAELLAKPDGDRAALKTIDYCRPFTRI